MHFVFRCLFFGVLLCGLPGRAEEAAAPAGEEVVEMKYRDPQSASYRRMRQPVSIELLPEWGLNPQQAELAARPPVPGRGTTQSCFRYPEDIKPTPEEVAAGTALTEPQRKLMRAARKKALAAACWRAYSEANAFNKTYAEEILQAELRGKHIIVNLSTQRGVFMDGEKVLLRFDVCSGRASKPTPTGYFHIKEKDLHHRSNLYNSARMEYFQRLTNDGVGFHQGAMVGHPSSHGCIRLSAKTAAFLWKYTYVGMPVFVNPR